MHLKLKLLSSPLGSTSRDILIASEVARSWLAGEIARIIQLGCNKKNPSSKMEIFLQVLIYKTSHKIKLAKMKRTEKLTVPSIKKEHNQ